MRRNGQITFLANLSRDASNRRQASAGLRAQLRANCVTWTLKKTELTIQTLSQERTLIIYQQRETARVHGPRPPYFITPASLVAVAPPRATCCQEGCACACASPWTASAIDPRWRKTKNLLTSASLQISMVRFERRWGAVPGRFPPSLQPKLPWRHGRCPPCSAHEKERKTRCLPEKTSEKREQKHQNFLALSSSSSPSSSGPHSGAHLMHARGPLLHQEQVRRRMRWPSGASFCFQNTRSHAAGGIDKTLRARRGVNNLSNQWQCHTVIPVQTYEKRKISARA